MRLLCAMDSTGILKSMSRLAKLYKAEGRTEDAVKLVKTGMRIFPTNLGALPSIR